MELKNFYLLSDEVVSSRSDGIEISHGSNIGIEKNMFFEIVEPGQVDSTEDGIVWTPGRSVSIVTVRESGPLNSRTAVLKQLHRIEPGQKALEYLGPFHAVRFDLYPPLSESLMGVDIRFHHKILRKVSGGPVIRFSSKRDSHKESTWGWGMGLFGLCRLASLPRLSLYGTFAGEFDVFFRRDHQNRKVAAMLLSAPVGIELEISHSLRQELVIGFGYRFGGRSDNWGDTVDGESNVGTFWNGEPPVIDIGGPFMTIGIRRYIFLP